jgi:hypothetical protein
MVAETCRSPIAFEASARLPHHCGSGISSIATKPTQSEYSDWPTVSSDAGHVNRYHRSGLSPSRPPPKAPEQPPRGRKQILVVAAEKASQDSNQTCVCSDEDPRPAALSST